MLWKYVVVFVCAVAQTIYIPTLNMLDTRAHPSFPNREITTTKDEVK